MPRFFEKISLKQFNKDFSDYNVNYSDIILPVRYSKNSAGYDFFLPFDITIKPNEIIKIPTGIKVCMEKDEFFAIYIRSGIGFKYNIRLCNQVGIIDSDYYNNENNEGNMYISIQNQNNETYKFKKGDRIVQGIFQKYLIVDNEIIPNNLRNGGLGSTNKGDGNNEKR